MRNDGFGVYVDAPYPLSIRLREKFEIWYAKVWCRLFAKPIRCDVYPKKPRENQLGCFTFSTNYPLGENISILQFDIKGDNDKEYKLTKEEFDQYWYITGFYGPVKEPYERFDSLKKKGKLYHVMPFRRVDYIVTKYKNKVVTYHAKY